jgi:hypothetical protein
MNNINLRIESDQAESIATSLKQFIAEEWNIEAKTLPKSTHLEGDQKVELGTALGIISIALSLPGFLESKMVSSLTQRIQAKQNLEKLIDWSLHNLPKDNTSIWVEFDEKPFLLTSENLTKMLNALPEPSE